MSALVALSVHLADVTVLLAYELEHLSARTMWCPMVSSTQYVAMHLHKQPHPHPQHAPPNLDGCTDGWMDGWMDGWCKTVSPRRRAGAHCPLEALVQAKQLESNLKYRADYKCNVEIALLVRFVGKETNI